MLVPERGDPTMKIGLFILRGTLAPFQLCFPTLVAGSSQSTGHFRRIQKLPPPQPGEVGNVVLNSSM